VKNLNDRKSKADAYAVRKLIRGGWLDNMSRKKDGKTQDGQNGLGREQKKSLRERQVGPRDANEREGPKRDGGIHEEP